MFSNTKEKSKWKIAQEPFGLIDLAVIHADRRKSIKFFRMRFWLVFILLSAGTSVGTNAVHDEMTRRLQAPQQTLNYRATYSADFQHYSEVQCGGAPPVLLISCKGSHMTFLNTSDDSIVCTQTEAFRLFANATSTAFQCETTCTGSECENVYRYISESFLPINGPFGSVFFMCEGNTVDEIDAVFVYLGGTDAGYCENSSSATASGRNYHIGRLGISCPIGDHREYVYDDTFIECNSSQVFTWDLAAIDDPMDIFACASGMKCGGMQCLEPFFDFWIEADLPKFFETCVESLVDKTSFPTRAPTTSSFEYQYTAQFEASWATVYDPFNASSSCGKGQHDVVVVISCDVDGIISIVTSEVVDSNGCFISKLAEILCYTNENTTLSNLVSVVYECVGPRVLATTVTVRESPVFCDSNSVDVVVRHIVSLGVLCEGPQTSPFYFSGDKLFKCTEQNYNFEVIENIFGKEGERIACSVSVTLPINSTRDNLQLISSVAIATNEYWLAVGDGNCFTFQRATGSSGVRSAFPSLFPTSSPAVEKTSTNAPVPIGTPMITIAPSESSVGSSIGIAVGGVAVGIAFMAVIGYRVRQQKRHNGTLLVEAQPINDVQRVSTSYIVPMASVLPISTFVVGPEPLALTYKDQARESSPDNAPMASVCPVSSSVVGPLPSAVTYKDQAREHADAAGVPLAVACHQDWILLVRSRRNPRARVVTTNLWMTIVASVELLWHLDGTESPLRRKTFPNEDQVLPRVQYWRTCTGTCSVNATAGWFLLLASS